MNLSRLATLAVFFIMVMSAFVTVPTYNVGADEGGCMDYEDTNDNGLYDEGEPCYDDDDGDRPPGEGRGCMDYDDTNENGLYDEGEPCYDDDGPDVESYFLSATMESLEDWSIEFYGEMPIDWSDDARSDIVKMCEEMLGTDGSEIDEECFEHWTEMMMSSDGGPDDCPFDRENPDSPCNAEVCRDDDGSEECEDYIEDYCTDTDDPVCVIWSSCFSGSSVRDCMAAFYDHCTSDASSDFCGDDFRQDDSGTWVQCWYDGTGGEACQPNWLIGLAAYESGDISAEDFMDYYMVPTFAQEDYHDNHNTALYELSHITLEEGTWVIIPDYLSSPNPNFICGNGERIIFSWINDGYSDCDDGADEQWYDNNTPEDHSDDCQEWSGEDCEGEEVNWFDCHDGTKVWINQVNNDEWNCPDGEDEYIHNLWSGEILLFKGHLAELNTDDEILAFDMNDCKWWDAEHTDYKCDDILKIELEEQEELTLATTGRCWENWIYDDDDGYILDETDPYSCDNWGTFSHTIFSHSDDLSISEQELIGFINGTVDQGSFSQIPSPQYYENQEFVLYETEEITISEGRWNGDILTQSWECYYDHWEDEDVCYSRSTSSYLYRDNFDPQNPEENLIASNGGFDYYDSSDCSNGGDCFMNRLDVSLAEGDYIIVIAAQDTWSSGIDFSTTLSNSDGHLHTFSGILDQSYWMNEESGGENIASVEVDEGGNITVYFEDVLEADGDGDSHYLRFHEYDEEYDEWNYIDDNNLNNDYNWTNFTCSYWCQDWDGESLLRITLENYSNDSGDSISTVAYFDPSDNSLEFVYPELIVGDERTNMPKADYECYECGDDGPDYWQHLMKNSTMYRDEEIGSLEAIENVIIIIEMMDDAGWFIDEEGDDWDEYYYCEWEGNEDGEDTVWWCTNSTSSDSLNDWWYYCENFEGMWYCTDDFGQNPDYACSADNNHYKEGGRPDMDYCGDDDDPAILDGIVGINDPEDNEPMPMSENMIGAVSDNEGLPLMMGSSFKVHFDGVDESLETHDLYIPIGGDSDYDEKWHVDINLLSGYEVISCEGCEDLVIEGSNAKFNANEPVTVIFGSRPDCDHTVTIGDDGYSFEPAELLINVGDTVCWIWDTEEEHNVVEIATKFDADMNLEDARIGFYSGDPSNIVDFRHTFTEDDKTHYYVCEPHISMSMAGAIIVGLGSEDDRIPEVIEDSGLPNISFIAGALVLVGAAGLRRRIH